MKVLKIITMYFCLFSSIFVYSEENLVVVVHTNNPIETMTQSEVIDLFMGKNVAFPNGDKAIAVDLNDTHIARKEFYNKLVGKSLASVNAYWSRIRFSGKRRPPIQKSDYDEITKFVEGSEISIGYIPESLVSNNMKVVFSFD